MALSVRLRRVVAAVLFLAYTSFTVLGGALVRCQEADGSISIEWRGAGCCIVKVGGGSAESSAIAASTGPAESRCGGCTDQALSETLSARAARGTSAAAELNVPDVALAPPAIIDAERLPFCRGPEQRVREMRAPHPPPCLSTLRTVVLRV